MRIQTLAAEHITDNLPAFLGIAADVDGEYWDRTHFLQDLPEKWTLSFTLWHGDEPVGYAIVSRKSPERIHLHHFMLAPSFRACGLGTKMMNEFERRATEAGARQLTLKVGTANAGARRFYERSGYRAGNPDGLYILYSKAL